MVSSEFKRDDATADQKLIKPKFNQRILLNAYDAYILKEIFVQITYHCNCRIHR